MGSDSSTGYLYDRYSGGLMIFVRLVTLGPERGGSSLRSTAWALAIACCLAVAACDDAPPEPQPVPGDLVVRLISPNGAEGGAVLATGEAGIVRVTAETPVQVYHWRESGEDRIVALRDESGEIRFRMSVADLNRPPRLDLVEVADGANRLRASLAGYEIDAAPIGGVGR